ncbi:restriction endonuclease subunit S [Staphylococcus pseudintermedius]|nr:restriction endonuclease subunit S [Staphylococcus pseudintermedius]EJF9999814.1 restriction endonuclease subunit S [Staphylococcus pseudintermedius]
MTEQTNTPELRFPEYKNEWDLKKIGNLANIVRGASPRPIKDSKWFDDNSEVGWLRISDVTQQNGKIKFLQQHLSTEGQKKTRVLHESHLLLSIAASVGKPVINYVKTGVHDGFLIFMKPKFNLYFMFNWLENFQLKWNKYGQPGSQVNLNSDLVRSQDIYIPHLYEEQEKIGNFFNKLDRQIELEEQKLEKLEEQKKGYMQKIFSQQLRFKDENGNDYPEWKKKKLDDVANYRRGSFPQPYGNKEWYDEKNGEPFVQVVDVDKNMKLHDKTKQKISDLAKPKSVKGFKGDIVVTLQGSIGRVALLHYDAYIDRTLLLIDSFKIEMNKNYFKYVLYLLFLKEKERAPGGTIKTITKKVLSNFKIDIPNVGEQEKIGKFFEKYDECIQKQSDKIGLLKERKKGFLQKMFV